MGMCASIYKIIALNHVENTNDLNGLYKPFRENIITRH